MSLAATVRAMVEAGCSPAQILAVVEQAEVSREAVVASRRAKDAERQRRKRHAESRDVTRTPGDIADKKKGLPHTPSKENNPSFTIVQEGSQRERDEQFERLWAAYPRRAGSNPKQTARKKFDSALKVDTFENILAGARAYAASRVGDDPRYTAQMVTWLGQRRWMDDHGAPARPPPPGEQASPLIRAARNLMRDLHDQQPTHDNVIEIVTPRSRPSTHGRGDRENGELFGAGGPVPRDPRRGGAD